MKIISILNQKGGVAKTTSTQNIAAGLNLLGKKVLAIDFDPQGNLTSGFGLDKRNLDYTIYDLLKTKAFGANKLNFSDVVVKTDFADILPTNIKMSKINLELGGVPGKESLLKEILKDVYGYDYVLIDCPPSLDTLTFNALMASNEVYIPVQTEFYALEGLAQLLNTIQLIKESLNENLKIEGVLLTMYDSRTNLEK